MKQVTNESLVNMLAVDQRFNPLSLSYADYAVLVLMLIISAAIGVYFGFLKRANNTTSEYLMGNKQLLAVPVGMSIIASQLSGADILSAPAEIYIFGINFGFNGAAAFLIAPILIYIVLPVIYNNGFDSCYEYLELRFNRKTRQLMTIFFMLTCLALMPAFIFAPALAFAQVTGINIHIINATLISICIFYTMFGGIKAVVWTDVLQGAVMVFSIAFIVIMGLIKIGGFSELHSLAQAGQRLNVNFSMDLRPRATFWSSLTCGTMYFVSSVGLNQSCSQRIVSLPTLKEAKRSILVFAIGLVFIISFEVLCGLLIFARYSDCDPIQTGHVSKIDKLLPYFVQDTVGHLPGISGLFVACVFSAALSTMSASLNSLAGIVYFDYIKPHMQHTERKATIIMKLCIFCFGIYCIAMGFAIERVNSIFEILFCMNGITLGAVFGVFFLGMLLPRAHGRAAFYSVLVTVAAMLFLVLGSMGKKQYKGLVASTEGCVNFNITTILTGVFTSPEEKDSNADKPLSIFDISFTWYPQLGACIFFVIAIPLSYMLSPPKDYKLDRKLLAPFVQRFVRYELANTNEQTMMKQSKNDCA